MLVLTRTKGQKIMIGDQIELTVVEVNGDQVRLGIKAPSDILVYREEIYKAIQSQNQSAAIIDLNSVEWANLGIKLPEKK
ncbi:carbon storage regulator CsrA [Paenibacillus sp. 481]|uniref:carbon storage regulator CsrA n=1 Tax=Paenibacillus sp. 481 TaxID=2835869 RepID=UPI001E511840|nr:carbon storage regulator CsrA [Paenibacillus sp. 481]UHA75711.1 carbon storage regulator CsrA [Paenibacillus sp. 481]